MGQNRVAIVGAGLAGRWHARYVGRVGAKVVAVVDPNPPAATALAKHVGGVPTFASLQQCLSEIDVAHICTPGPSHAAIIVEALQAKKHVLVEKPATQTIDELQRCLDLAAQHRLRFSAVHQFPWQRGMRSLRAKRDRLGEITSLSFATCSAGGDGRTAEQRREILLDILPHPLSLFAALLGPAIDVDEFDVIRFDSDELVLAGMCNGVRLDARIDLRGRPTLNELVATGTRATAHADLFHGFCFFDSANEASRMTKMTRPFRFGADLLSAATVNLAIRALSLDLAYPGLRELIDAFHRAVRFNSPAPVSAEEMMFVAKTMQHVRNFAATAEPMQSVQVS
jgi:predicted dehydrogenase